MAGFQPSHMRMKPQHLADGGVVRGFLRRLMGAPADAQQPPAQQPPQQQPQNEHAITQYSGMSATERRMKEAGLKDGGLVRGPGTGTSDSIKTHVRAGSYIMPADSTRAIGAQHLNDLSAQADKVPVRLSNGEYQLTPEQVHAVGVQALEAARQATHKPAARGFSARPVEAETFFADGGVVTDEKKKPNAFGDAAAAYSNQGINTVGTQAGASQSQTPLDYDPQARSDRAKLGAVWDTVKSVNEDAGRAIADVATLPLRGLAGAYDTAVVRPMRAAGFNAAYLSPKLVPDGVDPTSMTPFADQKRMRDGVAAEPALSATALPPSGAAAANEAAPKPSAPSAGAQSSPAAPQDARQTAQTPPAGAGVPQATQAAVNDGVEQVSPGIYRKGNSFGDSAAAVSTGLRPGVISAQNMAAADALDARYAQERAGQRALEAMNPPRGFAPGAGMLVIGNDGFADRARKEAFNQATTPYAGSQNGQLTANQLRVLAGMDEAERRNALARETTAANNASALEQEAMQQQGAMGRTAYQEAGTNARFAATNALQRDELALRREAQDPQTRAAQRQEALYQRYEAAKTPEERSAVAEQIRALKGAAEPTNRFTVVPGGQEIDPATQQTVTRPARVFNNQTGEFVGEGDAGQKLTPLPSDKAKLMAGQVYQTARGPARWDGKQFVAM